MKKTTQICPLKLDFDAPSCTESQSPLFQICSGCDQISGQKPSKLTPASKEIEGERFKKHVQNVTTKVPTSVTNMLPKESPTFFCVFSGPIPGWSPRRPRTGSRAQQHVKLDAPSWISGIRSQLVHTLWRRFGDVLRIP